MHTCIYIFIHVYIIYMYIYSHRCLSLVDIWPHSAAAEAGKVLMKGHATREMQWKPVNGAIHLPSNRLQQRTDRGDRKTVDWKDHSIDDRQKNKSRKASFRKWQSAEKTLPLSPHTPEYICPIQKPRRHWHRRLPVPQLFSKLESNQRHVYVTFIKTI